MERNAQADALDTARNTGVATKASARKAGDQHRPAPLNCLEVVVVDSLSIGGAADGLASGSTPQAQDMQRGSTPPQGIHHSNLTP